MYKVKVILGWENIDFPREMEGRRSPGEPQHGNDDSRETNEKNDRHKLVEQNCFKWTSSFFDAKQNKRTCCVFLVFAIL